MRTYGCRGRGYHAYDWRDRLTSQLDPNGGATIYSYDNLDNKRTLTDPDQNTTTWSYDSLGRAWKEINQAGASRNYSYDLAGKLLSKTDRDGRITAFEYDSLGRKTAEKWCDGTIVLHTFTYAYDAVGELTSASDPNATYTYTYDPLGRTVTTSGQIAALTPAVVLTGGYDDAGNLTQIAATIDRAADVVNNYQYDSAGRMTEATQAGVTGGNAVAPKQADLSYNADGQFSTIARYADLAGDDPVAASEYGYDGLGRLTTLTHAQGSTNLAGYTRQYDRANDLTHEVSVDGTANYSYDPTGQLTAATYTGGQADETYTYDPNGNRETANGSTYATGTDNQMTSDGTYTYSYDGEGNRTARWVASGAGETQPGAGDSEITTYTWDNRNRLTAVTHYASYTAYSASPPTPDQTVTYTYDVFNRWIGETTTAGGSTTQTRFVYGSNQIVLQFDMAGAGDAAASDLSHRYLWGPGVDELFSDEQLLGAPQVVWALGEELNTLGDLAVHSGGATSVVNHRVLSAFGELLSQTDPQMSQAATIDCLLGFTARPYDDATSLQNNLNRWYDAATGRWLSEDPIGYDASDFNPYRYCGNDPLAHNDPSGLGCQITYNCSLVNSIGGGVIKCCTYVCNETRRKTIGGGLLSCASPPFRARMSMGDWYTVVRGLSCAASYAKVVNYF